MFVARIPNRVLAVVVRVGDAIGARVDVGVDPDAAEAGVLETMAGAVRSVAAQGEAVGAAVVGKIGYAGGAVAVASLREERG